MPGPPDLPDGSTSDIDTFHRPGKRFGAVQQPIISKDAMGMAIDAPSGKRLQKPGDAAQSNAMQGIMEQGKSLINLYT